MWECSDNGVSEGVECGSWCANSSVWVQSLWEATARMWMEMGNECKKPGSGLLSYPSLEVWELGFLGNTPRVPASWQLALINYFFFFLTWGYAYLFLEREKGKGRERERERERETLMWERNISYVPYVPQLESNLKPRHVPWPGTCDNTPTCYQTQTRYLNICHYNYYIGSRTENNTRTKICLQCWLISPRSLEITACFCLKAPFL